MLPATILRGTDIHTARYHSARLLGLGRHFLGRRATREATTSPVLKQLQGCELAHKQRPASSGVVRYRTLLRV
jgi:hypothetical protein